MTKVKGQNFRFLISSAIVPEETNVSVTIQGNTEDTSSKDDGGLYGKEDVVSTSFNGQVDSYQAEPSQLRAILTMFNAAAAVGVGWDQTSGDNNQTPANANFKRSGQALLTDFTMQFDDRTAVNVSLQFTGTGALS